MKKLLLSLTACIMTASLSFAQTAYTEPFNGSTTLSSLAGASSFSFTQNNQLNVTMIDSVGPDQDGAGTGSYDNWVSYYITLPNTVNMASNRTVSVKLTNPSTEDMTFNIQVQDNTGSYTDDGSSVTVPAGTNTLTTFTLTIAAGKFHNLYGPTTPTNVRGSVDSANITQINFQPVGAGLGASPWNKKYKGDFAMDDLMVGGVTITGLFSPSVSNNMSITPNPATSEALVSYNAAVSNVIFNVSDVTGKVVKTVSGNGTSATINVSDLSKGMYFVTTISDNAPVSVSKLVVE